MKPNLPPSRQNYARVLTLAIAGVLSTAARAGDPTPTPVPTGTQACQSAKPETKKAKNSPEPTTLVTGSRVPQKKSRLLDPSAPTTAFPTVIITREQLDRTGRPTAAAALTRSPSFR